MASKLGTLFGVLLVIALIPLAFWAVIRGVLDDPGLVGTCVTAAAAIAAVLIQRDRENKREVAQRHREQLAPLYESLFERFAEGVDLQEDEQQAFILQLQRKLVLYGTTPVVAAWLRWLRSAPDEPIENDPRPLLRWEDLLFVLREDLGHPRADLKPGDLLRVYIRDADEYISGQQTD
jgi:hypothetical protein